MSLNQDISPVYLITTDDVKHTVASFTVNGNEGDLMVVDMDVAGTDNNGHAIAVALRALYIYHGNTLVLTGHTKLATLSDNVSSHWAVAAEVSAAESNCINVICTGQADTTIRWAVFGSWEVLPGNAT